MEDFLSIKQENIVLTNEQQDPTDEYKTGEDFLIDCEDDEYILSTEPSSPNSVPKPMEGLNEAGPTPFLKKTYQMVEEPETDDVISWSGSKKSFVVWDQHLFSTVLLPKHFKHNNFSSFIRQLNTYGFKKIDPDRWEFATEGFQEGQKHLLKNIKRKKQIPQPNSGIEAEIEKLNDDGDKLRTEISKLKHQQETTQSYLATINEKIESNEYKQRQIFIFMGKAFSNPPFLHKFLEVLRQKRELCDNQIAKKRKFIAPQSNDDMETVGQEVKSLLSPPLVEEGSSPSEGHNGTCDLSSPDTMSGNDMSWLWKDELTQQQSNFELEFLDLIAKPSDNWTNYIRDMVEQAEDAI